MLERTIINGLKDLIRDRESFINDNDKDNIFAKDKQVLEGAIELLEKKNKIYGKRKIIKEIDVEFKNIQKNENTSNALDFINEIIEELNKKYMI